MRQKSAFESAIRYTGTVWKSGDPYVRLPVAGGEIRFLMNPDDDPATVDNVDGYVYLDDGSVKTFTALTLAEVDRILTRWTQSGEALSGLYLVCPDLVLLRSPGLPNITAAVQDAVARGMLPSVTTLDTEST
jgi:hypothetical protein